MKHCQRSLSLFDLLATVTVDTFTTVLHMEDILKLASGMHFFVYIGCISEVSSVSQPMNFTARKPRSNIVHASAEMWHEPAEQPVRMIASAFFKPSFSVRASRTAVRIQWLRKYIFQPLTYSSNVNCFGARSSGSN